jgi:4-hydroxy-tetrahydrodipicolinate synthase
MFKGLSAFPITPTDAQGGIDAVGLSRLIARIEAAGVDSIGLLGSTGTYAYLDRAQRRQAVEITHRARQGALPLIVGVGALRTDAAVDLARDAAEAGAEGLLLAPVSYTPLTEEEVFQHFRAVAAATSLPLCIYNNPGTTHFVFSDALLQRLAELPGIAAVKMPLPAKGDVAEELARLRPLLPAGFLVGYSADWGCSAALLAGGAAWYSVIAGILPEPAVKLARAAISGDAEAVGRIEAGFQPIWSLFREFGSLRVAYAIADLLDLTEAQPPRPILGLGAAECERVSAALAALKVV